MTNKQRGLLIALLCQIEDDAIKWGWEGEFHVKIDGLDSIWTCVGDDELDHEIKDFTPEMLAKLDQYLINKTKDVVKHLFELTTDSIVVDDDDDWEIVDDYDDDKTDD